MEIQKKNIIKIFSDINIPNRDELDDSPLYFEDYDKADSFIDTLSKVLSELDNSLKEGELLAIAQLLTIYEQSHLLSIRLHEEDYYLHNYLYGVIKKVKQKVYIACEGKEQKEYLDIVTRWFISTSQKSFYKHDWIRNDLLSFFEKFCTCKPFVKAFNDLTASPGQEDSLVLALMQYHHFSFLNDSDKIETLLAIHTSYDELHKRHIEKIINNKSFSLALDLCRNRYDDAYERTRPYKNRSYNSEEIAEFNKLSNDKKEEYRASDPTFYLEWYARKQIDLHISLNQIQDATRLATRINLDHNTFQRMFRTASYATIAPHHTLAQKDDFINSIIEGDEFFTWDIEELCKVSNYWYPLITACEKRGSRLSDVSGSIKRNENELIYWREEQISMLKKVTIQYTDIGSSKSRLSIIKYTLKLILSLEEEPHEILDLVLSLKLKFRKRDILNNMLDEFLLENNLIQKLEDYLGSILSQVNELSIQSLPSINKSLSKNPSWQDPIWAEGMLEMLERKKTIYNIQKNWPENINTVPLEQKEQLLDLYKEAVANFLENSKKNANQKIEYLKVSFTDLRSSSTEDQFLKIVIEELIRNHPKRIQINEWMANYMESL